MPKCTVTYGRTKSANYQSERAEVSIDFDLLTETAIGQEPEILTALADLKDTVNKFLGIKEPT